MKKERSVLYRVVRATFWWCRKLRWSLAEKRLKWQRRKFYESLGLVRRIHFVSSASPFLTTIELDAAIYAYTGEVNKLKESLDRGVSANLPGLMELALFADEIEIVKLLLAYGAKADSTESSGDPLLCRAVIIGNPEIVKLLLAKGADANRKASNGIKPLGFAYDRSEGRAPLVELLEPVTTFDNPNYNVDDFLKMEDRVKAYYALCDAIGNGFRKYSTVELQVMSLTKFLSHCGSNGFCDMYWQARWAVVPSSELMRVIEEPMFAELLRRCTAIVREYRTKLRARSVRS